MQKSALNVVGFNSSGLLEKAGKSITSVVPGNPVAIADSRLSLFSLVSPAVDLVKTIMTVYVEDSKDERGHALRRLECEKSAEIRLAEIANQRAENDEAFQKEMSRISSRHDNESKKLALIGQLLISDTSDEIKLRALESFDKICNGGSSDEEAF